MPANTSELVVAGTCVSKPPTDEPKPASDNTSSFLLFTSQTLRRLQDERKHTWEAACQCGEVPGTSTTLCSRFVPG
jgi:hypothetical protein